MSKREIRRMLLRPFVIDRAIERKAAEVVGLRQCLMPKGISYDVDRVQTSPDDMVSRIIGEIDEAMREIEKLYADRYAAVRQIMAAIDGLESTEKAALSMRYLGGQSVRSIGEKIGYSTRQTYRVIDRAISKMAQMAKADML